MVVNKKIHMLDRPASATANTIPSGHAATIDDKNDENLYQTRGLARKVKGPPEAARDLAGSYRKR
jgi:hypothetical protein